MERARPGIFGTKELEEIGTVASFSSLLRLHDAPAASPRTQVHVSILFVVRRGVGSAVGGRLWGRTLSGLGEEPSDPVLENGIARIMSLGFPDFLCM